ncbi:hypothetical protein [Gulosibacter sp. 10]|uniref:hypothetical protein n=1 Tax=Gulosibacter sp. 10 TaxID=1255570 RepID=UPI00097F65B8|nr:hypothetical protein [Gulosibacter sp. 10]SJM58754.1 High molecular weight glutenin subunit x precursor [Gulosibacter sp. 10]
MSDDTNRPVGPEEQRPGRGDGTNGGPDRGSGYGAGPNAGGGPAGSPSGTAGYGGGPTYGAAPGAAGQGQGAGGAAANGGSQYGDQTSGTGAGYGAEQPYGSNQSYGPNPTYGYNQSYGGARQEGSGRTNGSNQVAGANQPYGANQTYGANQSYGGDQRSGPNRTYGSNPAYGGDQAYGAAPGSGQPDGGTGVPQGHGGSAPGAHQGAYSQGTYAQDASAQGGTYGQGGYSQGTYAQGTYGGQYPQQPGPNSAYGQPPSGYAPTGPGGPRKRNRKLLFGIIAAVVVVVLGLGTWGLFALLGKFGGARSPEAAVTDMFDSVASFNVVDSALALAPSERDIFQDAAQQLQQADIGASEDGEHPSAMDALEAAERAVDIEREDFEYETEEIVEGVELVTITSGTLIVDGDEEALEAAMQDLAWAMEYEWQKQTGADEQEAVSAADAATTEVEAPELPYEFDMTMQGGTSGDMFPEGFSAVTVKEGSGWYVSYFMTFAHYMTQAFFGYGGGGPSTPGDTVVEATPAATPEEVGTGLAEAFMEAGTAAFQGQSGDFESGIGLFSEAERTLLSLYVLPMLKYAQQDSGGYSTGEPLDYSVEGGFERFEHEGTTMILPDDLRLTADGDTLVLDGYCATDEGSYSGPSTMCLTDWPGFGELGFDELGLVVVQEGGGWVFSPYRTMEVFVEAATDKYLELREEGRLHELFG